jgi:hypothetical protein
LIGSVGQYDDVLAVLELSAVEETAHLEGNSRAFREELGRAQHQDRTCFQVAIEDATLNGGADARAQLDVDVLERRGLLLERARVGHGEIRPLEQFAGFIVRQVRDTEPLDEDRVRPYRREQIAHRLIEAHDERRHPDDGRDTDDDAEDRQP